MQAIVKYYKPGKRVILFEAQKNSVCKGTLFVSAKKDFSGLIKTSVLLSFLIFFVLLTAEKALESPPKPYVSLSTQIDFNIPEKTIQKDVKTYPSSKIRSYFSLKKSILAGHAETFESAANLYGLDPYLLPAVSMVESNGCKKYIISTNNCFGWGKGGIQFGSIEESIFAIAETVGTKPLYRHFQKNGKSVESFAQNYNNPNWQDYREKIKFFMDQIKSQKEV